MACRYMFALLDEEKRGLDVEVRSVRWREVRRVGGPVRMGSDDAYVLYGR